MDSLLFLGVENLAHRAKTGCLGALALGARPWYWRLGYALWLESLRGAAHRAGRSQAPQEGWQPEDFVYGETPIWTAYRHLTLCQFPQGGRLLEIGCGRATVSLVAALARGGRATGYEILPARADKARWLTRALQLTTVEIIDADASTCSYEQVDVVYLTPTTWSDINWKRLTRWLEQAQTGTRAVSLTQPLPKKDWEIVLETKMPYTWGDSVTYYQRRR